MIEERDTVQKVLIVDDAAFMRLSIKNMLSKYNLEIAGEASNGVMGVEMYKSLRPDVVTMDITMPEMSGIEALKAIKAFDPKAKVIMVSAMGQESMVKEAIISGAKTFIVKPFKEDFLYQTISRVLGI
ncbi:response regulator containing CheY-like receiver domain and AraC-type DNA-binding domain [Desulfosporosinus youngiae DSM 17734]|uniref:Stage 0 sporulation protein A homolog n=1 Tax=Desulfosporosinus youngiae DSM 17734 TaxID=768710 RepID=H5XSY5_9FIRM|nr:response regulator containing CheY-like receiver domain and AraC-type DNA-binding domain [Desulfosporosinus youngiae DSM 17734]